MTINQLRLITSLLMFMISNVGLSQNKIVVFQSDFGLKDGAVSAMKGVAMDVSPELKLYDLTHEIPAYNIWEASYRLMQTVPYYPKGTVFVSVVDPGVGTERKSVVLKTNTGQFIVTPDNGTLTLTAEQLGIEEVREIDEAVNRRKDSGKSYTFHGRDVYAYTAARLASGVISFNEVGKILPKEVVRIPYQKATIIGKTLKGNIPILDVQYGNIWTNIDAELVKKFNLKYDDLLKISFFHNGKKVYETEAPYSETFGNVPKSKPLCYLNSLLQLSFALNQDSFATVHNIQSGSDWDVEVTKLDF
ncbi:S-adenosyl-l-methionine hydroxide adenosyltransferase family protein [Pedobacter sp. V48]|uniref:SAM hydrolase/SAM-dependent halogenase family protein n=1 Tax=Pedobacter sp. V48 TaxID=509635 RepID=UPI0003E4679B|nr:S-adenosyl-l-methionine hydroxide adenosyltransferase family protein [Pedobacter sp. V48]ETZ23759.1 hypothetical protein N824_20095 [Pedobacter sp. V48]